MPLNDRIAVLTDPRKVLEVAWESSAKDVIARGYMADLIDALKWTGGLTEKEFNAAYAQYVDGI